MIPQYKTTDTPVLFQNWYFTFFPVVLGFTDTLGNDTVVNLLHAACTRCKHQNQQQKTSKPFLDTFRRPQMIDL